MANPVSEITLGIDVAKDTLVVYRTDTAEVTRLINHSDDIKAWLSAHYAPLRLCLEATSDYHLELVDQAHKLGITVYLVNPRQLSHYRIAVGERNKSDDADARLLARYLDHEADQLRPFKPPSAKAKRLWTMVKRRGSLVRAKQQLTQSLKGTQVPTKAVFSALKRLLVRLDQHIFALIRELGWQADYQRCLSIPGTGPVNAAMLTAAFHRGAFPGSDAFIAYLGMDIRMRESGRYQGQAKLSKCGESEARRLLYCAARPARSHAPFERYYQNQINKGMSKTAANVALARKIARIAFTLMSNQTSFQKIQEIPR